MKLNDHQIAILRCIAHAPRTLHSLTHMERSTADIQLAPITIRLYIKRLSDAGLIDEPAREGGAYKVTLAGQVHLDDLMRITPSVLICPASMKEPYRSEFRPPARGEGALRAFRLPSLGFGA